jgi:hypothetical protein
LLILEDILDGNGGEGLPLAQRSHRRQYGVNLLTSNRSVLFESKFSTHGQIEKGLSRTSERCSLLDVPSITSLKEPNEIDFDAPSGLTALCNAPLRWLLHPL